MRELIQRRWPELSSLLDQAFDVADSERERWIDRCCPDDLRPALRQLLADSARASVIDAGSDGIARILIEADADTNTDDDAVAASWIGRRLGAWRLTGLVGEGGMASVFRGERDDGGFDQEVAVKILRHGMLDPYEQQRFVRERQILARLEHPHIARLIDGGLTVEGVPWFAMEFVQGRPITRYCDDDGLDIERRLRLFLDVCDVVAHAHQALVVHRDLKPSNILVKDDGTLKLLDFGVARLIDPTAPGDDDGELTITSHRRLTPAYAAPEQWGGEAVTTQADVYALGVLLHELLTGERPSRRDDDSLRNPSSLVTGAPDRQVRARSRASTPKQIKRRLAGDLDMILRTALQIEPARRYASVAVLAEDIRRHLDRRPVLARPDRLGYRIGRFLRRNSLASAASALIAISILIGVGATLRQAEQARQAATLAQFEASRVAAVKDFLLGLFHGAAPNQAGGETITALELLDRSARELRGGFSEAPVLRNELRLTLAGIYRELGQYRQADELLARIAADGEAATGWEWSVERGRLALAEGDFETADAVLAAALARIDRSAEAVDADRGDVLSLRAEVLAALDRREEATMLVNQAIALNRDRPDDPLALARDQAVLAQIAFGQGDLEAADAAMREALALRLARLGASHTQVATSQHDLAVIILQRGDVDEAETLLSQALATRQRLLGPRHLEIATSLLNLGAVKRRQGDREAARSFYGDAVGMLEALFPEGHPELANGYNSLAVLAQEGGDVVTSAGYLELAIEQGRKALGDNHTTVGIMLGNLAALQRVAGDLDAARDSQQAAIDLFAESLGEQHHLFGIAINGRAAIHLARGDPAAALDDYGRALVIVAATLGEEHMDYAGVLAGQAEAMVASGESEQALAGIDQALAIMADLPPEHVRRQRAHMIRAEALAAADRCVEARDEIGAASVTAIASQQPRLEALRRRCPG